MAVFTVVQRAAEALRVDGQLMEATWPGAAWSAPFVDMRGPAQPAESDVGAILTGRASIIYSGLFSPALTADELETATEKARTGGARGVSLFNLRSLIDAHWRRARAVLAWRGPRARPRLHPEPRPGPQS